MKNNSRENLIRTAVKLGSAGVPVTGDIIFDGNVTQDGNTFTFGGGSGEVNWGDINGTLSDQSDLQDALDDKSDVGHTHTASDVTDFSTAADARIAAAAGVSVASLSGGKIPTSQLPALALTDVYVVNSEIAQLALTAQEGDVAVRTDENKSYIHNGGTAGDMTDWQELLGPTDAVSSVNGQTGTVVLTTTNISEGTGLYFTDERAQDAVGTILTDSSTIDFTYNDGANTITASLKDTAVTPGSYTSADITVDQQGRITSAASGSGGGGGSAVTGEIKMWPTTSAPSGYLLCDGSAVSRTTYADLFAVVGTTFGAGDGSTTFNLPDMRGRAVIGVGTGSYSQTFTATAATDLLTITANDVIKTGAALTLTSTGTLPAGLATSTTYYAIVISSTTIKLATTRANANLGTAIDITDAGSGTHTLTLTLTARALGNVGGEEAHQLVRGEIAAHLHETSNVTASAGGPDGGFGSNTNPVSTGNSTGTTRYRNTNYNANGDNAHNNMPPYIALNFIIKT